MMLGSIRQCIMDRDDVELRGEFVDSVDDEHDLSEFRWISGVIESDCESDSDSDSYEPFWTTKILPVKPVVAENFKQAEYGDYKLQKTVLNPEVRSCMKSTDFECDASLIQEIEKFASTCMGDRYKTTVEPDSYLVYKQGDHFKPHVDTSHRYTHLATAVYIVKEQDLSGGSLCIDGTEVRGEGTLVVFRTTQYHYVQPVVSGEKHTVTFRVLAELQQTEGSFSQSLAEYDYFVLNYDYTPRTLAEENLYGEDVEILDHVKSKWDTYFMTTAEVSVAMSERQKCLWAKFKDPDGVTEKWSQSMEESVTSDYGCVKPCPWTRIYIPDDIKDESDNNKQVIKLQYFYGNQYEDPDSTYYRCIIVPLVLK